MKINQSFDSTKRRSLPLINKCEGKKENEREVRGDRIQKEEEKIN